MGGESSAVLRSVSDARRKRHRIALRVLALLGLAAVCLLFPDVGPNRHLMAVVLVAVTPVPVLLPALTGQERWMVAQSVFDVAATVVLIGMVPDVWHAGLVIVVTSPAASAALIGRRPYVLLEAFGLGGLGAMAAATGVEGWQVPLATAAVLVPLVASYVDVFLAHQLTAAAHLDEVAESSSAIFWEVDPAASDAKFVSGPVEDVLGYSVVELPGPLPALLVDEDRELFWREVADDERSDFVVQCRARYRDGRVVWLRLHGRRVAVGSHRVVRGIAFDVTELVDAHDEMRRRAEQDQLTGLANRAVLVHELDQRLDAHEPVALFVLDLDRFKEINDTLGHGSGDRFLQTMAERLHRVAEGRALVARMGGDEFAVVSDATPGLDAVLCFAEEIVASLESATELHGIDVSGSASCGVAVAPLHGTNAADLLRRADLAMYAAKRNASRLHVFEFSADEANVGRLRLTSEIEATLATGQLRLWFQPKVHLSTGTVMGAEGLLRWHHPERGVLSPAEFLDVVELSRHRRALTGDVIRQGVEFVARTMAAGWPLPVAVNISVRDLLDDQLAPWIADQLRRYDVPASMLVLEVTEREIMDDRMGFEAAANAVRSVGVELAIDDFGTGHSSLLRLHQLPVTELKIDRSFIRGLGRDEDARIIVRSIIELGDALGHRVVAEGIERAVEAEMLLGFGCTVGQGFRYSPAVPADDLMRLLGDALRLPATA